MIGCVMLAPQHVRWTLLVVCAVVVPMAFVVCVAYMTRHTYSDADYVVIDHEQMSDNEDDDPALDLTRRVRGETPVMQSSTVLDRV
jgi:hypothetical protein